MIRQSFVCALDLPSKHAKEIKDTLIALQMVLT